MPDAHVAFVAGTRVDWLMFANVLGEAVVREFPLEGRALDPATEIDIEFQERSPWDQPLADIRVTIEAHGAPDRLRKSDISARMIRLAVEKVVGTYTVDVRVRLPEVGYSSESYDMRKVRSGLGKAAIPH